MNVGIRDPLVFGQPFVIRSRCRCPAAKVHALDPDLSDPVSEPRRHQTQPGVVHVKEQVLRRPPAGLVEQLPPNDQAEPVQDRHVAFSREPIAVDFCIIDVARVRCPGQLLEPIRGLVDPRSPQDQRPTEPDHADRWIIELSKNSLVPIKLSDDHVVVDVGQNIGPRQILAQIQTFHRPDATRKRKQ